MYFQTVTLELSGGTPHCLCSLMSAQPSVGSEIRAPLLPSGRAPHRQDSREGCGTACLFHLSHSPPSGWTWSESRCCSCSSFHKGLCSPSAPSASLCIILASQSPGDRYDRGGRERGLQQQWWQLSTVLVSPRKRGHYHFHPRSWT